jgi:tetratricopeptide (TPR) repeat protein
MRKTSRLSVVKGAALAIGLLLAGAWTLQAQTETFRINGKLVSPTGAPPCGLCEVSLEDEHDQRRTRTDIIGQFAFEDVAAGGYVIRVSAAKFREARKRVYVDAHVEPVTIELEEELANPITSVAGDPVLHVSTLLKSYPRKAVELYKRGTEFSGKKKNDEAVRELEQATRIAPNFYAAHEGLGRSYQALGRLDDAQREFLTAERLNPTSADPAIQLAALYLLRHQTAEAVQAGFEAVRRNPRSADAFYGLGLALYCTSLDDLAEGALERTLILAPHAAHVRLLLGNLYLRMHAPEKALAQIKQYLEGDPKAAQGALLSKVRSELLRGGVAMADSEIPFPVQLGASHPLATCGGRLYG